MSRIALISDIHANLPALEAVMKDIEQLQCDAVYCLGDIVGYNANPSECLEFIRSRQIPTVRGNHDEEAIGEDNPAGMNPVAYSALMWTRQQLSDEQKKWLRRAPFQRILPNEIVLVHATQDKPNSWAYVTNVDTATHSINMLRDNQFLCFNGHTHVPRTFIRHEGSIQEYESGDIQLLKTNKYLINVGSVGQPRDGDPRAAYGILDTNGMVYYQRRVEYDLEEAQRRILAAGLPDMLARDWGKEYNPSANSGRTSKAGSWKCGAILAVFLYSPVRNVGKRGKPHVRKGSQTRIAACLACHKSVEFCATNEDLYHQTTPSHAPDAPGGHLSRLCITRFVPGGPIEQMMQQQSMSALSGQKAGSQRGDNNLSEADMERLEEQYSLQEPIVTAYLQWLGVLPKKISISREEFGVISGEEPADREDEYAGISDTHTKINLNETGEQVVVVRPDKDSKEVKDAFFPGRLPGKRLRKDGRWRWNPQWTAPNAGPGACGRREMRGPFRTRRKAMPGGP